MKNNIPNALKPERSSLKENETKSKTMLPFLKKNIAKFSFNKSSSSNI